MDRKQIYGMITSMKLQDEVKAKYGKNYTMCSNGDLLAVVNAHSKPTDAAPEKAAVKEETKNVGVCNKSKLKDIPSPALARLVDILAKKRILLKSEVDAIMKV